MSIRSKKNPNDYTEMRIRLVYKDDKATFNIAVALGLLSAGCEYQWAVEYFPVDGDDLERWEADAAADAVEVQS